MLYDYVTMPSQMKQKRNEGRKVNREKGNKNMCDKGRIKCECLPAGVKVSRGERHCAVYEREMGGWLGRPK